MTCAVALCRAVSCGNSSSQILSQPDPRRKDPRISRARAEITSAFGRRSIPAGGVDSGTLRVPPSTRPKDSSLLESFTQRVARRTNTSMYSPSLLRASRAPRRPRCFELIFARALRTSGGIRTPTSLRSLQTYSADMFVGDLLEKNSVYASRVVPTDEWVVRREWYKALRRW